MTHRPKVIGHRMHSHSWRGMNCKETTPKLLLHNIKGYKSSNSVKETEKGSSRTGLRAEMKINTQPLTKKHALLSGVGLTHG